MLGKLLNKIRPRTPAATATAAPGKTPTPAAAPVAPVATPNAAEWQARLDAAQDDATLLELARSAPLHAIRHAAVRALRGEDALKQAEREFRGHDKRLHRAARETLDTLVRTRAARSQAAALIDAARALTTDALLPANRLVELDHAWRALDATLLDAAQTAEFTRLQQELATLARTRSEHQRDEKRRSEAVATALAATQAAQAAAAQQAAAAAAAEQQQRAQARQQAQAHSAAQARQAGAALEAGIQAAEQALAAGHLHDVGKQLAELRELAQDKKIAPDARQRERLHALQAEHARLKGWQAWGGEQAREELACAAEALAQAVAGDKLNLQQHAHDIEQLRARWKTLGRDHLGNAASQALWKRFDAALHAAWQPVAAQQQKLQETREENLQARQTLLAALEAAPLPGEQATTGLSGQRPGEQALAPHRDGPRPLPSGRSLRSRLPGQTSDDGWRAVAHSLDEFQAAWRKLGPLEHTVPREAQRALQTRHAAAVARLEAPLREARRRAHAERKQLIDRARALQTHADGRDIVAQVRALQAEWQQHAKAQPLGRKEEHALWGEFKAATDAIFAARGAAHQARDAELAEHQATRAALIARLTELAHDDALAPHDLKRAIAEIDAQWRHAGPAPKAVAAKLDAAFRTAHAQALQHAAAGRQRQWQTACDALLERVALCDAAAAAEETDLAANRDARWTALPPLPALLPAAWTDALRRRYAGTARSSDSSDGATLDATLLRLEAALDIASPPAHQEARRELKLQAMKRALEARETRHADDIDALLAAALALPRPTPEQSQRLRTALAARTRHP